MLLLESVRNVVHVVQPPGAQGRTHREVEELPQQRAEAGLGPGLAVGESSVILLTSPAHPY